MEYKDDSVSFFIDNWQFELAEEKLKLSSVEQYNNFLLETVQYEKIKINFLADLKDYSFKEISGIVKKFLSDNFFEDKELVEQYSQCFYVLYLIDANKLTSEYIINECKIIVHQNKLSNLTKTYMLYRIINYFLFLKRTGREVNFFLPMKPETFLYFMLVYLQRYSPYNSGARLYYDVYINESREVLLNSLNKNIAPKIAICFYGMCRGDWKSTLQKNFNNLAKPLNADVFMFSWTKYSEWAYCGGRSIWARILPIESFRNAPKHIQYNSDFKIYFPKTYNRLMQNYLKDITPEELRQLQKENIFFRKYYLVEQDDFNKKYYDNNIPSNTVYLQYGLYQGFKLIEQYENENKFEYDYVALIRVDAEINGEIPDINNLRKLKINEICDSHNGAGILPIGNIIGRRCAMEKFSRWFLEREEYENLQYFTKEFTAHESSMKYCIISGIKISPSQLKMKFLETECLKGMVMPDIESCLCEDIADIKKKNVLNEDELDKCLDFFKFIKSFFKKKDLVVQNNKNLTLNINLCENYLQDYFYYKLGRIIVVNSKNIITMIFLPFYIISAMATYGQIRKMPKDKIEVNFLHFFSEKGFNSSENLKIRTYFSYKLGRATVEAIDTWYKGGFIKLFFKVRQLKREAKNVGKVMQD